MDRKNLLNTFTELVKIDSVSGEEKDVAEFIIKNLRSYASDVGYDTYGNVIARIDGEGDYILLNAHMDTVEPGRGINPLIKDDKIHTDRSTILGADPKAGIASILEALRTVVEKKIPHKNIEIVFTKEEEVGLKGVKHVDFSKLKSKVGVVFDGEKEVTNVTIKGPGYNGIDVVTFGKASHAGASPERGISSIRIASEIISKLNLGRIDLQTTSNIGLINGGTARNTVPSETKFFGEIRSHSSRKIESITKEWIHAIDTTVSKFPGAKSEIKIDRHFDPYILPDDSGIIRFVTKVFENVKIKPHFISSGGGTDAHIFNKNGIDTVVVGTGGFNAHTTGEYALISEIEKTKDFCIQLIRL